MKENPFGSTYTGSTRESVLDTVDRVCELCFGLFMALTFVGAVSVANAAENSAAKMLYSALGCNIAWGLTDAALFLVRTMTNRSKRISLVKRIRQERDPAVAIRALQRALPTPLRGLLDANELEIMRTRIVGMQVPNARHRLDSRDFAAAAAIFALVVLATFPVVLPFVIFKDVRLALVISRLLTLLMLFTGGYSLGRAASGSGWWSGLGMVTLGCALTALIIALGG